MPTGRKLRAHLLGWMMTGTKPKMEVNNCQAESSHGADESEKEGNPWLYLSQILVCKCKRGVADWMYDLDFFA